MGFEDVVAVLGQAFNLELKVVQGTTVFEVASDDGGTKVQILLQNTGERNLVLMSADSPDEPAENPSDEWKPQGLGNFHVMQV